MNDILVEIIAKFELQFGRRPKFVCRAPGRVNLIGEHIDYNGGLVLPMAIERDTYLAADLAPIAGLTTVYSHNLDRSSSWHLQEPLLMPEDFWACYVKGVLELHPAEVPALDILVQSFVPIGAGLSSSAALEVATLKLVEAVTGKILDPIEGAKLCQRAEHEYAGVPCGIMDQMASIAGQTGMAVLIDCSVPTFSYLKVLDDSASFLIVNSMQTHDLSSGGYAERRSECDAAALALGVDSLGACHPSLLAERSSELEPVLFKRAKHVLSEIKRVEDFVTAIGNGDNTTAGTILYESHASLRDDFEVSASGLNQLVQIAEKIGPAHGMFGCRMTGGGFGGSVIALVDSNQSQAIAETMVREYEQLTGILADSLLTRPGPGAEVLRS